MEVTSKDFYTELNNLSYDFNTYDIEEIIKEVSYYYGEVKQNDDDSDLYWNNQSTIKNY